MPPGKKRPRKRPAHYVDLGLDNLPDPASEPDSSPPKSTPGRTRSSANRGPQETADVPQASSSNVPTGKIQRPRRSGLTSFSAMHPAPKDTAKRQTAQRALTGPRLAGQNLEDGTPPPRLKADPSAIYSKKSISPRKPALRQLKKRIRTARTTQGEPGPARSTTRRGSKNTDVTRSATRRLQLRRSQNNGVSQPADEDQQVSTAERSGGLNDRDEDADIVVAPQPSISPVVKRTPGRPRKQVTTNSKAARPRGRPRKDPPPTEPPIEPLPRLSGRKLTQEVVDAAEPANPSSARRGRPPKHARQDEPVASPSHNKRRRLDAQPDDQPPIVININDMLFPGRASDAGESDQNVLFVSQGDDQNAEGEEHELSLGSIIEQPSAPAAANGDASNEPSEIVDTAEAAQGDGQDAAAATNIDEDISNIDGHENADPASNVVRLYGQWISLQKIVIASKKVGESIRNGVSEPPPKGPCRDKKVRRILTYIDHVIQTFRRRRENPADHNSTISFPRIVQRLDKDVGSLWQGAVNRDDLRRSLAIYLNLFPKLVRLLKEMVIHLEFLDGGHKIKKENLRHLISVMQIVDELRYGAQENYDNPTDVPVVASVRYRLCAPLVTVRRTLSAKVEEFDARLRRQREEATQRRHHEAEMLQAQRDAEANAPLLKLSKEWHMLHLERKHAAQPLYANKPWENDHLAHNELQPETDATGTEMERVDIFRPRVGPLPDRVVAARAVEWAPIEDDVLLQGLQQFRGELVLVKIIRAHCKGKIHGDQKGVLRARNVTEIAVRAADLRVWLMREQLQQMGGHQDWVEDIPRWVPGKMPQRVFGNPVALDVEEVEPL